MSLKLGKWKVNVNGAEGDLILDSLDQQNVLSGQMVLDAMLAIMIQGFWDDTARTILFNVLQPLNPGQLNALITLPVQFKGFLLSTPTTPEPGQDILWTLTGFYQVSGETNISTFRGQARRNTFGWFAQTSEVA
jgi:hypothetical protein